LFPCDSLVQKVEVSMKPDKDQNLHIPLKNASVQNWAKQTELYKLHSIVKGIEAEAKIFTKIITIIIIWHLRTQEFHPKKK
jgi:hypothetical protein